MLQPISLRGLTPLTSLLSTQVNKVHGHTTTLLLVKMHIPNTRLGRTGKDQAVSWIPWKSAPYISRYNAVLSVYTSLTAVVHKTAFDAIFTRGGGDWLLPLAKNGLKLRFNVRAFN